MRIFKTRSLAAEACEKHRVLLDGMEVKPSRNVKQGETLTVKKLPVVYTYHVIALTDKRQAAPLVKNYITDATPQDELDKIKQAQMTPFGLRDRGTGRPTKKERRTLEQLTSEY
jgi:ribosome-associated heat shock protein Hsp15